MYKECGHLLFLVLWKGNSPCDASARVIRFERLPFKRSVLFFVFGAPAKRKTPKTPRTTTNNQQQHQQQQKQKINNHKSTTQLKLTTTNKQQQPKQNKTPKEDKNHRKSRTTTKNTYIKFNKGAQKNSLAEKYWFQKTCVLVLGGFQLMQQQCAPLVPN